MLRVTRMLVAYYFRNETHLSLTSTYHLLLIIHQPIDIKMFPHFFISSIFGEKKKCKKIVFFSFFRFRLYILNDYETVISYKALV